MIKIIIFDLDGTLLNTLEDLKDSTNFALQAFGYPKRSLKEVCAFVGNGVKKLIERALPEGENNPCFRECLETFKNHYKENMYNKTAPYEGTRELLQELKKRGIKTAIVSNKFDLAVKELSKKYFKDLIDSAKGENEAQGIRKKPAPDTILSVLKEFNLEANEALYVGDSDVDIMSAKNASMPCVSVSWGFRDKDFLTRHGAKIIINEPKELIKYL